MKQLIVLMLCAMPLCGQNHPRFSQLQGAPVAFSQLPNTPYLWQTVVISDANPDCSAGSGTNLALCIWNGTSWGTISSQGAANAVFTSVTAGTINSTGAGFTQTFTTQTAPSNPPSNQMLWYGDSGTNKWTCLNHDGSSCAPGGAAFSGITAATNSNAGTFAASGNTWDFTATTQILLRKGAGLTTSANGGIGYDTTNSMWHVWQNAADNFVLTAPASGTFTNGDCVSLTKSGNIINIVDAATTCGGSGSASEFLFGSGSTAPSTTVANWVGLGNAGATEAAQQIPVTRSGTVSNLQCRIGATLSSSMTYTLTVSHGSASNGAITSADTAVTCTMNSTNTSGCGDTTHSFTVAAGDVLDVHIVPANSPTSSTVRCSVQF